VIPMNINAKNEYQHIYNFSCRTRSFLGHIYIHDSVYLQSKNLLTYGMKR